MPWELWLMLAVLSICTSAGAIVYWLNYRDHKRTADEIYKYLKLEDIKRVRTLK